MKKTKLVISLLLIGFSLNAKIQMPWIFSDNMVIQRDIPVKIWGWAEKGEEIQVVFGIQSLSTITGENGKWMVRIEPVNAGGPYVLEIKGQKESIIFKNVLAGDVWICSGQSNMEWLLNMSSTWDSEKEQVANSNIRLFYVPKKISSNQLENTDSARWTACDLSNAQTFSAIGYYFGKNLQKHLNVPIGLINSNWGGTVIETWTSFEAMYEFPEYRKAIEELKSGDYDKVRDSSARKMAFWQANAKNDQGVKEKWFAMEFDDSKWETMTLPQLWEKAGYPKLDGVVWFRKDFELSTDEASKTAILSLGPIDDSDDAFVNGIKVGSTYDQYSKLRVYQVPSYVLKTGKNVIAVKVTDTGGGGGIWGENNQLFIQAGAKKQSVAGDWKYCISMKDAVPQNNLSPNRYPSLLYNGMINPLINFAIKGVIWYQGESNADQYEKYRQLFPALINDWRKKWEIGNFPFLYVQLANFEDPMLDPKANMWAGLRDAQTMALQLPATGMAVTIDIGNPKDIHPRNKMDVGYRLYLSALKVAYNENLVFSGPMYEKFTTKGNSAVVEFETFGSAIVQKDKKQAITGFEISGEDKKFYPATAIIIDSRTIKVFSKAVSKPMAVRYAWKDNPGNVNFYNKEMLPSSPFRTDNW